MATTTFGAELMKARKARKWNRDKLAMEFYGMPGNITTISRWEQGINLPASDSIERLVEIFDLSYPDTMFWYGLAGKLPRLKMPSKRQIVQSLDTMIPALKEYPYPAYVLDSRYNRICLLNHAAVILIGGIARVRELADRSVFQLLFSEQLGVTRFLEKDLAEIREEQIRRFKIANMYWQHEDYYMEYPERLKSKDGLLEAEYNEFRKLWEKVHSNEISSIDPIIGDIIFGFKRPIRFRIVNELIVSLGNLFSVSWYNIADRKYDDAAKKVFGQVSSGECVKLWEILGAKWDTILD